jgi:lipid II:glycine glycyltransferase (peptidoglycan interpeptide bridge formation enzyme)
MKLIEIKEKKEWNDFVGAQEHSALTQSWEWGDFNAGLGNKVLRFGVEEDGELICALTLIKKRLPLGMKYWYVARGPVFHITHNTQHITFLFEEISGLAKQEGVIFLRFEPQSDVTRCALRVTRTIDVQPSKTLLLDLTKTEDELLKGMHQKTRYNIRLAEKKGVEIFESENLEKDFEEFWKLMSETKERDGFRLHEKKYYQRQLRITNYELRNNSSLSTTSYQLQTKLFLAKYNGEIIAAGIFSFFGDTATYLHGASSNKFREVMAPYALQWGVIKTAKKIGCKYYDFSGISEQKWPGVTRFKKGFGGFEFDYAGTYDVAFSRFLYGAYKMFRKIRRAI